MSIVDGSCYYVHTNLRFFLLHIHTLNKIWWLCLVPISTTRFASEVGYKNAPNLKVLYKENTFFMNNAI